MEIEPLHPIQIERFRSMSFRKKMAVSRGLFCMARRARRALIHDGLECSQRNQSSTRLRAQGVFRRNVRLDLMDGSN